MVVFTRLKFLGKPLILCATTGFLWANLKNENDLQKDKLKSTIHQADLLCQAFKEKQGIPGRYHFYFILKSIYAFSFTRCQYRCYNAWFNCMEKRFWSS
jgi:hypothetical protein